MCMMPQGGSPPSVDIEPVQALAGQGITNEEAKFKMNKPSKSRKVRKSLRVNKPS